MNKELMEFRNVYKYYGDTPTLEDVSFRVNENEFFALLGPSSCGKTTTPRIKKLSEHIISKKVSRMLSLINLPGFLEKTCKSR